MSRQELSRDLAIQSKFSKLLYAKLEKQAELIKGIKGIKDNEDTLLDVLLDLLVSKIVKTMHFSASRFSF